MKTNDITHCGFYLWSGGTIWVSSYLFVDPEVAAKWFWMLWGTVIWIWIFCFLRLRGKTTVFTSPDRGCSLSGVVFFLIGNRMEAENRWYRVARISFTGNTQYAFPEYARLEKHLGMQPLFLYNYAAELNVAGYYAQSLSVAQKSLSLYSDYDLYLLQADNCTQLGNYPEAICHLQYAVRMCPGRLRPHHRMLKLYI